MGQKYDILTIKEKLFGEDGTILMNKKDTKINRNDMLELTRRMTLSRNCFVRAAGAYIDDEGYIVQMKKIQDVMLKACAENEAIWRNIWKGGI